MFGRKKDQIGNLDLVQKHDLEICETLTLHKFFSPFISRFDNGKGKNQCYIVKDWSQVYVAAGLSHSLHTRVQRAFTHVYLSASVLVFKRNPQWTVDIGQRAYPYDDRGSLILKTVNWFVQFPPLYALLQLRPPVSSFFATLTGPVGLAGPTFRRRGKSRKGEASATVIFRIGPTLFRPVSIELATLRTVLLHFSQRHFANNQI